MVLLRRLDLGGTERQCMELARVLSSRGHDVVLATLYEGGALESEARAGAIRVRCLRKCSRWDLVGPLRSLQKAIRDERPELVQTVLPAVNLLGLAVRVFAPRVKLVWGVRNTLDHARAYDRLRSASFWLEARLAPLADALIVNSALGRRAALARGYPAEKLVVIENGIDLDRFRPDPELRARMRGEWGVTAAELVVLQVARVDPVKCHETLLLAVRELAEHEMGGVRIFCVGGGDPARIAELESMARVLGISERVRWVGARGDIESVYNAADVVTLTSRSEGFPNVLAEALACGKPCVSTDVGDARRIVGACGRVVPAGDPARFAAALRQVLVSLREGGGFDTAAARARVSAEFGRDALARRTEVCYQRILGEVA